MKRIKGAHILTMAFCGAVDATTIQRYMWIQSHNPSSWIPSTSACRVNVA